MGSTGKPLPAYDHSLLLMMPERKQKLLLKKFLKKEKAVCCCATSRCWKSKEDMNATVYRTKIIHGMRALLKNITCGTATYCPVVCRPDSRLKKMQGNHSLTAI